MAGLTHRAAAALAIVALTAGCGAARKHRSAGEVEFRHVGCLNCHRYRGSGSANLGAHDLSHIGSKLSAARIETLMVEPPDPMPTFAPLSAPKRAEIASFLASSR